MQQQNGQIRFIRKNGRIIPIKVSGNASSTLKQNMPTAKREAKVAALNTYHSRVDENKRDRINGALGFAKAFVATGAAAGTGAAMLFAADKAIDGYESKARKKRYQYTTLGIGGTALAAASVFKGKGILKIGAGVAGIGAAAVGAFGTYKSRQHENRARKMRQLTSGVRSYIENRNANVNLNF